MSFIKKIYASIATSGTAAFVLVSTASAAAEPFVGGLDGASSSLDAVGQAGGLTTGGATNLPTLIGGIINVVLGLLGIVFVVLIVIAGIMYMISQGEAEKVKKATGIIRTSIIGLIITIAAYAISSFVISALVSAVNTP